MSTRCAHRPHPPARQVPAGIPNCTQKRCVPDPYTSAFECAADSDCTTVFSEGDVCDTATGLCVACPDSGPSKFRGGGCEYEFGREQWHKCGGVALKTGYLGDPDRRYPCPASTDLVLPQY